MDDDPFFTDAEECPDCHGDGMVTVDRPGYHDLEETCERCGGSGALVQDWPDEEE